MTDKYRTLEARLNSARMAIVNAMNDTEILGYVSAFGYDSTKLSEGKDLYDAAHTLYQTQKDEYSDQYNATLALEKKVEKAHHLYMKHVKVARVAFQSDSTAYGKLRLAQTRKHDFYNWFEQASLFYENALASNDIAAKLATFGIIFTELQEGQQAVAEAQKLNDEQQQEIGAAQNSTKERDQALAKLEDWVSDFIAIARIALAEKPQLLEKLGIGVPS